MPSPKPHSFLRRIAALFASTLLLTAQTTVTFTDAQVRATAINTSAPNSPTTLALATGAATQSGVISGTGSVVKTGAGTLTLSGPNTYTGGTTISAGTLLGSTSSIRGNIVNNAALIFDQSATSAYSDAISGSGSLTKSGAGTLYLYGANTYSGPTVIAAGTLILVTSSRLADTTDVTLAAGAILELSAYNLNVPNFTTISSLTGAGSVSLTLNSTLAVGASNAPTTFSGGVSGSGSLRKVGTGTLTLTGDITPSVGTTISAGTLQIGDGGTTGSITGNIVNNAALIFNRSDSYTYRENISGTGSLTQSGTGTLILTGTQTYTGGTTISAGTLQIGDPYSYASITGNIVNNAALVFSSYAGNLTYDGTISGSGSLTTEVGFGTLVLTGANTYSGGTTISSGLVNFSALTNFGSGNISINGGGLQWATGNTFDITSSAQFNRVLGPSGATFDPNGNDVTFASALSGSGRLTKSGTGPLTLSGNNSYTGGTKLADGVLALGSPGAIGTTGPIYFEGGTLQFSAANTTDYSSRFHNADYQSFNLDTNGQTVTLASAFGGYSSYVTKMGDGTLILRGDTLADAVIQNFGGTLQINDAGTFGTPLDIRNEAVLAFNRSDTVTLPTRIYGDGSLVQSGTGTLTLSGPNTYTGGTTITHGILAVAAADSLGTGSIVIGAAGTLDLGYTVYDLSRISGSGHLLATQNLAFAADGDASLAITFAGSASLEKSGDGTLTLSGANTYSGGTNVRAGTLALGSNQAIGTSTLTLNGGALSADGADRTLANAVIFNSDTTVSGSQRLTFTGNFALARNRDLTIASGATLALSGVVSQSGGTRALLKYGAGTLALNGANTYTGGTLIAEGTVRINNSTGSAFGTGAVTVESGATLAGVGSFSGALQLNGHLAPGNSPGTITLSGGLNLAGGSILDFELGTASDLIRVSGGTLSGPLTGLVTVNLANSGGFTAGTYTLFDFTSAATSSFDLTDFTFGTTIPGYTYALAFAGSTLALTATASAIPEPSTYAAIFGAAALAFAAYRRRKNNARAAPIPGRTLP